VREHAREHVVVENLNHPFTLRTAVMGTRPQCV
jgi:hypothetical protein